MTGPYVEHHKTLELQVKLFENMAAERVLRAKGKYFHGTSQIGIQFERLSDLDLL